MKTHKPLKQISVTNPSFQEGYMAGMNDPGFITATQPEKINNPYPDKSMDAENYEAGYRAAIH